MLVFDNCTLHFSTQITDMLNERGVELVYLPPYSPDFNLIELCFAQLQKLIQRDAYNSQRDPVGSLLDVMTLIFPSDMAGYYKKCGLVSHLHVEDEAEAEAADVAIAAAAAAIAMDVLAEFE